MRVIGLGAPIARLADAGRARLKLNEFRFIDSSLPSRHSRRCASGTELHFRPLAFLSEERLRQRGKLLGGRMRRSRCKRVRGRELRSRKKRVDDFARSFCRITQTGLRAVQALFSEVGG